MNKTIAFPNGNEYEFLYSKYFDKGVDYISEYIIGNKVLDLCGGTGRLSKTLFEKGYDVTYLDICERMCLLDNNIPRIISTVEDFANNEGVEFDSIICMQAVNYWFNTTNIDNLAKHIKPGGKLIFNTFINKPSDQVSIKKYSNGKYQYEEEYWLDGNLVKHYQRVFVEDEKIGEHYTEFHYISISEYLNKLKHSFGVDFVFNGSSAILICTRKQPIFYIELFNNGIYTTKVKRANSLKDLLKQINKLQMGKMEYQVFSDKPYTHENLLYTHYKD